MSSPGSSLRQIGQIAVAVQDVDRAVAFYRDVLGLSLLFRFPGMAFFDCGGVRLYLTSQGGDTMRTSILYYRVDDIREAAGLLEARGVVFEQGPQLAHRDEHHELWLAFFRDSEGNTLALMNEVPQPGR
jgi:catechol 2,3-dioxygenase-like lactoylglutathione lyase family enzyme